MMDLKNIGHDMHFAKRVTPFGVLKPKICYVELPCTLGDPLLITSQPFMRCS
jgi:hypothetical protein